METNLVEYEIGSIVASNIFNELKENIDAFILTKYVDDSIVVRIDHRNEERFEYTIYNVLDDAFRSISYKKYTEAIIAKYQKWILANHFYKYRT